MNRGRIYSWVRDPASSLGGRVELEVVELARLREGGADGRGLSGRFVRVRNASVLTRPVVETDPESKLVVAAIGDAPPDDSGDYLFDPGRGGGRIDKPPYAVPPLRDPYISASRFGEVNTYYYLDRIASYTDGLLKQLGAESLPPVIAVVNAHNAGGKIGVCDGEHKHGRWLPFQGGHYRLPSRRGSIAELHPVAASGEIHLGPGRGYTEYGALPQLIGDRYRCNASHNAGILYHEYGHHITRHTADFLANRLQPEQRQNNRKTAIDEGTCDYFAASMLGVPHIWAWHRRHDETEIHPRSLVSAKTMADFDPSPEADPHLNGTIWGAALWDLRQKLASPDADGARRTDLLVLRALLLIGQLDGGARPATLRACRRAREGFQVGLEALLCADRVLHSGTHRATILGVFGARGIHPATSLDGTPTPPGGPANSVAPLLAPPSIESQSDEDILDGGALAAHLSAIDERPFSVIVLGDVMLAGRAREPIRRFGPDYPFAAMLPLLRLAPVVVANLEGPFARYAGKEDRRYSYRVNPRRAGDLARAGIGVVTLANNHLLDCGREGVLETLDALREAGVAAIGAGRNEDEAHAPHIQSVNGVRIGVLGYYWNRRTAAGPDRPGSAMDTPGWLQRDIAALRPLVDRIVVTCHWGVPYVREPAPYDRSKARLAVDLGADAVIGHHPHIVQPFEVYKDAPIFYSVGNFAFGSGNSRAESIAVCLRFEPNLTEVGVYPCYVRNRDPRVNYQPKVLRGDSAERILGRLAEISGEHGDRLRVRDGRGTMELPRAAGITDGSARRD